MVLEEILKEDETCRYELLSRMVEYVTIIWDMATEMPRTFGPMMNGNRLRSCRPCMRVFLLKRNRNGSHRTISWDMENGCLLLLERYRC